MFNPILRGWVNYYGLFYKSEMYSVLKHVNRSLARWVQRKYKKLARHKRRANDWLGKIARREPKPHFPQENFRFHNFSCYRF
ncbi:group II intron maturase-specific domain-containing protein [Methanosarcina mazei]|uniref:group II intron maturase-specific domain-containing protein n=1 Tax=Methanosarcina mazei TaxID=2209 RepID=UPI003C708B9F